MSTDPAFGPDHADVDPEVRPPRRGWRGLAVDLGPLRTSRDFRLLWTARAVSFLGSQLTYVALPYQVYETTGSPLAVGLLGLCELVPLLLVAPVGGVLADARDRRRLFVGAQAGLAAVSALLLANALLPQPRLAVLYAGAALAAGLDGLGSPALSALVPRLVRPEQVPAAAALQALYGNLGFVLGPLLAGLLLGLGGPALAYGVDAGTFALALLLLARLAAVPPPEGAPAPGLRSVRDGLRFVRGQPAILGTYVVDFVAMVFGMPTALFPALAARFGGTDALGLLYAAPAVGSLLATATSGWTARVRRHGLAVCVAAAAWGLSIAAFGLAPSLWLALPLLACAGAADMVSGLFRMTIWMQAVPDRMRGRLAGIEWVNVASGPALGNLEAGVAARLFGVRASVVSGGLLCVAGVAVVAALLPAFRRYEGRAADPAA